MNIECPPDVSLPAALSEVDGGALSLPAGHPASLAETLKKTAREQPDHGIIYLDAAGESRLQTYPQLLDEAARIFAGLRERGLKPGQAVIFQLEHNHDFIPAFWACALGGFVPVPVSIAPTYEQPHSILAKLRNAWSMLGAPPILAGAALAPRLEAFAVREKLEGFTVLAIDPLRRPAPAAEFHPTRPDDLALLLLTSGSTGLPKAVRQTHRSLLAWGASAVQACEFGPADVSINWMPLDHVGGLVMFHLRDVVAGCRQVHAPTESVLQRPLVWLDWIERFRATITWAPNFAYGLINEQAEEVARRHWDLSSMRFILNGGEAIVSRTARRFLEILAPHRLPATAMRPAWGMSETTSGVTYSRRFTLAATRDDDPFVEVGGPIPGIRLRIVDQHDRPVPEGKYGRLQIRGISITEGYHQNPEANEKAFTEDGWFITGDLGVLREGRLSITGREKDVIIINGVNFYSHEIEAVVEEIEGVEVSFTAACAIRQAGENTDQVGIFFCPTAAGQERLADLVKIIRNTVSRKEGVTADFIVPLTKSQIPKTAIGKIQRAQLKAQFEAGEFAAALARVPSPTVASGLFGKQWKEAPLSEPAAFPAGSHFLIFADASGLGAELARELRAAGHACVTVGSGAEFSAPDKESFQLNPSAPAGFKALGQALGSHPPFTHVVYAWAYPPAAREPASATEVEAAQARGSLGLLRWLRAWPAPADGAARVRLLVVTSRLQFVSEAEPVDWVKAPLLGLVRTLPHEFAWLECAQLDLEGADPRAEAEAVRCELAARTTGEFAWRQGRRLASGFQSIHISTTESSSLRSGGLYLLSGGLGGIGRAVARRLAGRHQARLLLLGRVPLAEMGPDDERGETLRSLQAAGAAVHYEAGDLLDPAFIRAAIDRAVERWGQPLNGVIHLAGEYHEAALAEETDEGWLRSLRPKLLGAWSLQAATRGLPGCRFIHFSSVLGHFGALGTGAYAAANAGLDAFAQAQRQGGVASSSLLWSLWSETGMGRGGSREGMAARGWLTLSPEQGLDVLERAWPCAQAQIFAGLDPSSRLLRQLDPTAAAKGGASGDYVAPRTELEQKLARMWEEILSVPRVGLKDNFFELGGRSLLAARLFARIDRELGRKLPLAVLFKAATLESLAAMLDTPANAPPPPCRVLPVQPKGSRPPFFCIPGGGSDAIVFQDLSRELGPDQPFYGLQAHGLDAVPVKGEFPSVEQVAADFIKAIRGLQPQGPYFVGGHCFGCLLAWEVASQLKAQGQEVGLLALFDPIVSNVFSDDIIGRDRVRYHFQKFMGMSLGGKCAYFVEKIRNFGRTLIVRQRIAQSYDQARSMHRRYQLRSYPGRAVIFLASDSFFKLTPERDPRRYYETLAQEGVQYIEIAGDHHAMLHHPAVPGLAAELRACLARATTSAPTPVSS